VVGGGLAATAQWSQVSFSAQPDKRLLSVTAILALQIAAAWAPIGVAATSRDGQICLAMPPPALTPGTTVTLIQPDPPQSVLAATIDRPVLACARLERAMISGPYYLAHPTNSTVSDSGTLWVAFSGRLGTRTVGSGAIVVQLSAAYPNAQVRSCTSSEGLHLTVWSGTPLKSQRLWHEYYYLGYDVEASCDDRDAGDAAGSPAAASVTTLQRRR
jgi:hypothetical protein